MHENAFKGVVAMSSWLVGLMTEEVSMEEMTHANVQSMNKCAGVIVHLTFVASLDRGVQLSQVPSSPSENNLLCRQGIATPFLGKECHRQTTQNRVSIEARGAEPSSGVQRCRSPLTTWEFNPSFQ